MLEHGEAREAQCQSCDVFIDIDLHIDVDIHTICKYNKV